MPQVSWFISVVLFLRSTSGEVVLPLPKPVDPLLTMMDPGGALLDPLTTNAIENSLYSAAKSVLTHNLIPRFKIPRGNLSYLANPHWEVLYFLKYGRYPITANRGVKNKTARLYERLRNIKSILDRKSDMLEDILEKAAHELSRGEGSPDYSASPEGIDVSLIDPDAFFTFQGPLGKYLPTKQELEDFVREYERTHGEIKEEASGPPEDNEESNSLDDLALAVKSRGGKSEAGQAKDIKRDGILKYFMDRATPPTPQEESERDPRAMWMKTFLVDHDPNWVRQRMRHASEKAQGVPRRGADDTRRTLYSTGGGGISSRSGGGLPGAVAAAGQVGDGGVEVARGDDPSQGPRRKFQTQGW